MRTVFLLSGLFLLAACSNNNEPSDEPFVPTAPTDTTMVVENIPAEYFLEAFSQGGWVEAEVYDEFADGSTGKEILSGLDGYTSRCFSIVDDKSVREYHSSSADLTYFAVDTVAYAYNESEGTLVFKGGKLDTSLKETFTVLSIEGDEMRCRGKVFVEKWSPDAVSGIYVFKRMSDEMAEALATAWQNEEWKCIPVMTSPISQTQFSQVFQNGGWMETGVYNMYEDGTVSEQNLFYKVEGFAGSLIYVEDNSNLKEFLSSDANPSWHEVNKAKYTYAHNRIEFNDARYDDLRKIF